MRKFNVSVRRMRGPRRPRTRIGPWPFIVFIVLSVAVAIAGRWIESHYEPAQPAALHKTGGNVTKLGPGDQGVESA